MHSGNVLGSVGSYYSSRVGETVEDCWAAQNCKSIQQGDAMIEQCYVYAVRTSAMTSKSLIQWLAMLYDAGRAPCCTMLSGALPMQDRWIHPNATSTRPMIPP